MDNLSRFYIELSTNAEKLAAYNSAKAEIKRMMLEEAGLDNVDDILALNEESMRKMLANKLIDATGKWHGIETNAGNSDNRDSTIRLQRTKH